MTEKEMFLNSYEREFGITLAFLDAMPAGSLDFRPYPNLQSAQELAWSFAQEERVFIEGALDGDVVFKRNPAPDTFEEIRSQYHMNHKKFAERINALPDGAFNEMVTFGSGMAGAKRMRRGDVLWLAVMDAVHHRGQFSVYIRMTGGKVPPLYTNQ
ncbi:MAG: DinB family protein [bacterium]|nr:DinB family protein [bacterium]MDZ4285480.1 DinB family protein [Candidatus Sungbacteria bacterium]